MEKHQKQQMSIQKMKVLLDFMAAGFFATFLEATAALAAGFFLIPGHPAPSWTSRWGGTPQKINLPAPLEKWHTK